MDTHLDSAQMAEKVTLYTAALNAATRDEALRLFAAGRKIADNMAGPDITGLLTIARLREKFPTARPARPPSCPRRPPGRRGLFFCRQDHHPGDTTMPKDPEEQIMVPRSLLLDLRLAAAVAYAARERSIRVKELALHDSLSPSNVAQIQSDIAELTAEYLRLRVAHNAALDLLTRA